MSSITGGAVDALQPINTFHAILTYNEERKPEWQSGIIFGTTDPR